MCTLPQETKKREITIKRELTPKENLVCRTLQSILPIEKRQKMIDDITNYISPRFRELLVKKFLKS